MAAGLTYLNNELYKYGLSSTGNIQTDVNALKLAKKAKGESTTELDNFTNMIKKTNKGGQPPQGVGQGEPPWFSMMKFLGIQPQGSPEADFAAIQTKISQMQTTNLSADQKANLTSMQAQLEQYMLQTKQ